MRIEDLAPLADAIGVASIVALVGAVALWVLDVRDRERPWVAGVLLVTLLAVAVRLAAPWGSHDLNVRNPGAWVDVPRVNVGYGLGWTGLARMARAVWPGGWTLRALPDLAAVLSALHVPLLAAWARHLGTSASAAWGAAGWLALHAAAVRFGHTDVQTTPETLWVLVALLAVARWNEDRRPWMALLAGLATGLAVHARPESMVVVGIVPAYAAMAVPAVWRERWGWGAAGLAAVVGLPQVVLQIQRLLYDRATSAGVPSPEELASHPLWTHGVRHLVVVDPTWSTGVVAVGLVLLVFAREIDVRWRVGALVVCLGLVLLVAGDASWTPAGGHRPGFARHQLRLLPFALLAGAWGLDAVAQAVGAARWVWPVAVVAMGTTLPTAWDDRVGTQEFRAFADWHSTLAEGCVVYRPAVHEDAGFRIPVELMPQGVRLVDRPPASVDGCTLYYRSAECSLARYALATTCDAFEADHALVPLDERWLPAGAWIYDDHAVDPVRVGLYRVEGPRGAR